MPDVGGTRRRSGSLFLFFQSNSLPAYAGSSPLTGFAYVRVHKHSRVVCRDRSVYHKYYIYNASMCFLFGGVRPAFFLFRPREPQFLLLPRLVPLLSVVSRSRVIIVFGFTCAPRRPSFPVCEEVAKATVSSEKRRRKSSTRTGKEEVTVPSSIRMFDVRHICAHTYHAHGRLEGIVNPPLESGEGTCDELTG